MTKNNSIVSIIMPVYNGEKFIAAAIQSVLNQTYKHWELIIINDGSKDKTEDVILNFSDTRIQYFKHDNKGVSVARNKGLSKMKGDYFCFLDSDDLLSPRSIEARLAVFNEDETIEFVDGRVEVFNTVSEEVIREYMPVFKGKPLNELIALSGICFFGISWMIKRKENKIYKFKDGLTHGEDLLFYMSISNNSGGYTFTEKLIYQCRQGHVSAMTDLKKLEAGYKDIYRELTTWDNITLAQRQRYLRKSKSIMFKTYLAKRDFVSAIKVLFR